MSKQNYIFLTVIILLASTLIFTLIFYTSKTGTLRQSVKLYSELLHIVQKDRANEHKSEGKKIPADILIVSADSDTLSLGDVLCGKSKPILVFRYNIGDCVSCKQDVINIFVELTKELDPDQYAVIGRYGRTADLKMDKKIFGTYNVYHMPYDDITPVDKSTPYLFVADNDRLISMYIPGMNAVSEYRNYLEIVKSRFFGTGESL